tara:strand:- start:238 stop:411 length:174 start_codon:yes stop_codon:yes gene_type:complete
MKKMIIILIFLVGCKSNYNDQTTNTFNKKFFNNLSFEEFKVKLIEYANKSPYPNIED